MPLNVIQQEGWKMCNLMFDQYRGSDANSNGNILIFSRMTVNAYMLSFGIQL